MEFQGTELDRGVCFTGRHWNSWTFASRSLLTVSWFQSSQLPNSLSSLLTLCPTGKEILVTPSMVLSTIPFLEYFCLKKIQNIFNRLSFVSPQVPVRRTVSTLCPLVIHQTLLSGSPLPYPHPLPNLWDFSLYSETVLFFTKSSLPSNCLYLKSSQNP